MSDTYAVYCRFGYHLQLVFQGEDLIRCDFLKGSAGIESPTPSENVLRPVFEYLDAYFQKQELPSFPKIKIEGSEFQKQILSELEKIPYGQLASYKQIVSMYEADFHKRGSAQAVGGAIGKNPLAIFIGCHRIIGNDGCLRGFAGGLDVKADLLRLEGHEVNQSDPNPGKWKIV